MSNNAGTFKLSNTKGTVFPGAGIRLTEHADDYTGSDLADGHLIYSDEGLRLRHNSAWVTLAAGATVSLNAAYDAGAIINVDAAGGDLEFDLADSSTDKNVQIKNISTGTIAAGLLIDTENAVAGCILTNAVNITTSGVGSTIGTAVNAADGGITNAIDIGANTIKGTTAIIDFTNFDVLANGNTTVGGDLTVSGTYSPATLTVTTAFNGGTDGSGIDVTLHTTTGGDNVLFDASERNLLFTDCHIHLQDNDNINFGAGSATGVGDFKIYSNGTHLYLAANADVAGQTIYLGDDTYDLDVVWEGDTDAKIFQMDSSNNQIELNGCNMRFQDDDILHFGDGATTNGDFKISSNGTDLFIQANANVAGQAVKIGDYTTNDVDLIVYGVTSGDYMQFDSSDDSLNLVDCDLIIAETGTETALDVSSAATGVHCTELNSTGVLTDGFANLGVLTVGDLADGGVVALLNYATGTPHANARILEIAGSGKDLLGIEADVDTATGDAYSFNCGGTLASGKAVMVVKGDAAINASAFALLVDGSDATFNTNNPVMAKIVDNSTNTTLLLESVDTGALGAVLELKHNGGAEANDDVIARIQFTGEDDAHADEAAGRIDCVLRDEAAADPDFDMIFYATVAGTETALLELNPTGVCLSAGILSTLSTTDLVLHTNEASNSGVFTIFDGAAGEMKLAPSTTGIVHIANVDNGALGAVLKLSHHPGDNSEANSDVIARLQFEGQDDAGSPANNLYGQIDCVIVATTAGSERGRLDLYAGDPDAGGVIIGLSVDNDGTNGIVSVGDSTATGILQSAGDNDLTLQTGNSTTGSINIVDGANEDIELTPNGTGSTEISGASIKYNQRDVAAGTAADSPVFNDGLVQVSTDGGTDCTVTLPEAANNLGLVLTFQHDTDAGKDVILTRAGADTLDEDSDLGNTTWTSNTAGAWIQIMAVGDNIWAILARQGGVLG